MDREDVFGVITKENGNAPYVDWFSVQEGKPAKKLEHGEKFRPETGTLKSGDNNRKLLLLVCTPLRYNDDAVRSFLGLSEPRTLKELADTFQRMTEDKKAGWVARFALSDKDRNIRKEFDREALYEARKNVNQRLAPDRVIVPMKADGNCFFRSLAYAMYGSPDHHGLVRADLVTVMRGWLKADPDATSAFAEQVLGEVSPTQILTSREDIEAAYSRFLDQACADREWNHTAAVTAAAILVGNVVVHDVDATVKHTREDLLRMLPANVPANVEYAGVDTRCVNLFNHKKHWDATASLDDEDGKPMPVPEPAPAPPPAPADPAVAELTEEIRQMSLEMAQMQQRMATMLQRLHDMVSEDKQKKTTPKKEEEKKKNQKNQKKEEEEKKKKKNKKNKNKKKKK